jgi:hypothetical protein
LFNSFEGATVLPAVEEFIGRNKSKITGRAAPYPEHLQQGVAH